MQIFLLKLADGAHSSFLPLFISTPTLYIDQYLEAFGLVQMMGYRQAQSLPSGSFYTDGELRHMCWKGMQLDSRVQEQTLQCYRF